MSVRTTLTIVGVVMLLVVLLMALSGCGTPIEWDSERGWAREVQ